MRPIGFTTRGNAAAHASGEQNQNRQCRGPASAGLRAVSSQTRRARACKALFFPRYVVCCKAAFAEHCWLPRTHRVGGPTYLARWSRRRGPCCPSGLENGLVGGGPEDALLKQPLTAPALAGLSIRRCRRIFIQWIYNLAGVRRLSASARRPRTRRVQGCLPLECDCRLV
jgi:hypothetical protein